MRHLIRECYSAGGYVFATKAVNIAREAGHKKIARLASNENPYPPSPEAVRMAEEALSDVNRYPDEHMSDLSDALKRYHGDFTFVTGVGMDGVIETVIRTLIKPGDRVSISTPTFSFYNLAIQAQGGESVYIRREEDFGVDVEKFIEGSCGTKLSFLCSPNNPTGTTTSVKDIELILKEIEGILFLDNAYVDFADVDYRPLVKKYDNLILGRTMSKAFSLAGLRVGYAFIPEWYKSYYMRAETPFALNSVSAAAAAGALSDRDHVKRILDHVRVWREKFINETKFPAYPSGSNFVLFDVAPLTGEEALELLAKKGVVVRSCTSFPDLGNHYIRVNVGDTWENELFLTEIEKI